MTTNTGALPSRHGLSWGSDEIQKLLQSIKRKETIEHIAAMHQRTVGGIKARLRELAAQYHFNDGRPIEEIMKFTGLSTDEILDTIQRRKIYNENKENRIIIPKQKTLDSFVQKTGEEKTVLLLTEIRDLMKELVMTLKNK